MDFDPRFRIRHRTSAGHEIFILGVIMNSVGRTHHFADHRHAKNFLRYLFSLTARHPQNHLTARNVICRRGPEGRWSGMPMTEPQAQHDAFVAREFPAHRAHELLCDDGAYAGFVVRRADGHLVTNLAREENGEACIDVGMIEMHRGRREDLETVVELFRRSDSATYFDQLETPTKATLQADLMVQALVRREMGGEPILTVSHRDQLDHNQTYHIHRLLRMPA